ncbi:LEAF RUST 10 DISEASE-RESISTANCE LOCUS RECEPTOR-LIKE PROTEIN KINASE-like 1.1 [Bienertia sinuspersici]
MQTSISTVIIILQNNDDKYESCSTSISCGKLQNVGYPFWGLGRPQYCGHPALQLHCPHNTSDHYPVLKNGDVEYYYVQGISNISSRMTIQLQELSWTKNSCAFNLSNEFDKILTLTDNVNKIRLFYKCPKHYAPQNHSVTCWSEQAKVTAFYLAKPNNTVFQQCVFAMVPVIIEEQNLLNQGEKTLSDVLKKGYEVYYTYSSHCNTCQASGGICASSNDTEFTCFRKNHKSVIPGAFFLLVAFNVGFCCCMKPKFQTSILGSRRLYTDPTSSNTESGSLFCGIPIGQFINEIMILTRLCHQNLVKLYGCTSRHSQELLLVYEFIPKGTVADHLYGNRKGYGILSFAMRMKIATESASALAYLHASDVIHRDVKTNNILLDENLSVKVADFGLSRLFPIDATHVSTAPQGTPGYLDPNYNKCYQVTSKSDVYSFGVVLVELISSLPAVDTSRKEDEINLSDYAMIRIQHGTLNELVDQRLGFESDLKVQKMITLVAELAFRCLQHDKELRPSMAEVLEALKQIESMDYEPSMANDMDYSKETLKQTSMTWGNDINPHSKISQHLPSPNSVIDNWTSRSTSNTMLTEELNHLNAGDGIILDVLKQGYEVDYLYSSACFTCQDSGGICGSSNDKEFTCFQKDHHIHKSAIPGAFLILIALNIGFCCFKPKLHSPKLLSNRLFNLIPWDTNLFLHELQEATNNFSVIQELGHGGYGIDCQGKLTDGTEVAVKRLYEKNYKQIGQFINEIEIFTHLHHNNLIKLYGRTTRHSRELLLYTNSFPRELSLIIFIKNEKDQELSLGICEMKIAIESASAVSYLQASDIIHRDVKTNNILLDNSFSVNVADFGLSRLFRFDTNHVSTAPQGTPGYLDPEYNICYQLISSLPAVDISRQEDEINLSDYAMHKIQQGKLNELIDHKLGFESDFKVNRMITLVAEVAFRCLQQDKDLRPSMDKVLAALKQIESMDYDLLEAEDINRSTKTSKQTSILMNKDVSAISSEFQLLPSPNYVMENWSSKSSAPYISA